MYKTELANEIAKKANITKHAAEEAVNAFIDVVTNELKEGRAVRLVGFGTFETVGRAAREGRNPQTGETMQIGPSRTPKFKAGKALKEAVNS